MYYFIAALICAVVSTLPTLIARRFVAAGVQAFVSFWVFWGCFYWWTLSTVYPMFGIPGLFVVVLWCVSAAIVYDEHENGWFVWIPGIFGILAYLGGGCVGSEFVRTDEYQKMIGTMETREWTQDVQPKDPRHMRMSTKENALYVAQKAIGQDGSIGSQFQVEDGEMSLQMIQKRLWYVAPLEFASFGAWRAKDSPGYIMVSAENPDAQPILVNFPEGQQMKYSPGAYFENNLERYLRNRGYLGKGLYSPNFEVDENGHGWWVVTVFEPTIMWSGERVQGVVIVDPATGDNTFYELGKVPSWVDRVIPASIMDSYLDWWGTYVHGWGNTFPVFGSHADMVEASDQSLIYGTDDVPEWVTDITSQNNNDNSLIGLVYTNSRTGKSVYYKVAGGGTNTAVLQAVNENQQIKFRSLHGADPQLYNVYGTMAAVVPLFNNNHAFQGVAIVPIANVQKVAVGNTQYDALRQYEKIISDRGGEVALSAERTLVKKIGVIDRLGYEVTNTGNLYYFHLDNVPHLFTAGSGDSPKLVTTVKGDRIAIEYYESSRDVVPLKSFDNLSLKLLESVPQKEVRETVANDRDAKEASEDRPTVEDRMKNLTPEELRQLKEQLPKK
ncbi:MAG: hypothetical protein WCV80_00725 [Candidatus Paceibacterota bacterium]|jgi:hypothetical protein